MAATRQRSNQKSKPVTVGNTIRINAEEWSMLAVKDRFGGRFTSHSKKNGKGAVIIGLEMGDSARIIAVIIHEVLEAILTMDETRWNHNDNDDTTYLFVFDHEYLNGLGTKLADALLSCGLVGAGSLKFKTVQTIGDGGGKHVRDRKGEGRNSGLRRTHKKV